MATLTYYRPIVIDNYLFMSCDMLRIKFNMNEFMLNRFNRFITTYEIMHSNVNVKKYFNISPFKYRNLLAISDFETKNSFSLGLVYNDLNKTTNDCFIEFNPNKCINETNTGLAQPFLDYIKQHGSHIELVRYDLAIDIPIEREFVSLDKDIRKYTKLWFTDVETNYSLIVSDMEKKQIHYKIDVKSKSLSNCTEYLGQRNKSGFVKLYNKQIESDLDKPITRLEITLDSISYDKFIQVLPNISIYKNVNQSDLDSLNDTEKVLLKLLQQNSNCDLYLNQLGRKMQDKLKRILYANDSILDKISKEDYFKLANNILNIINKG